MTPARVSMLLPLLALVAPAFAACKTERKPLTGFDSPPPGIVLDSDPGGELVIWPILALPETPFRTLRPRLNGQDAIIVTSDEGFYDYPGVGLAGWTGGQNMWFTRIPDGTYVVELVDDTGQSWGQSAPLPIPGNNCFLGGACAYPAVVFAHFDGQVASWNIDPAVQDSDPATDEITVTNMVAEDVVVERCLIVAAARTSCTPVGTVAPQADLRTVEPVQASSAAADHQALFIHLASDAGHSYQRDLVVGSGGSGFGSCQIERIVVHGERPPAANRGPAGFAMSSCYGYSSGAL